MQDKEVYVINDEDIQLNLTEVLGEGPKKQKKRGKVRRRRPGPAFVADGSGRPRLAATCSIWLSGTGHFLHREWKLGTLYSLMLAFTLSFHYLLRHSWSSLRSLVGRIGLGETDLLVGVFLIDLYLLTVLLSGVYSAFRVGRAYGCEEGDPTPHPLWPACASMLVPGWGQIVNGQIQKAMVFLFVFFTEILAVAIWYVLPGPVNTFVLGGGDPVQTLFVGFTLAMFGAVGWSLSLYDAILVARYRRSLTI